MPTIWTIGYEQATQAAVVQALRGAGVEVLADIRHLPLSRRPGFSKSSLRAAVEEAGVAYRHIKPLGTPADGRAAARRGDHSALEKIYAGQLELPEAMAAMAELRELASEKRVALLCYERDASECHRSLLIGALLADFEVVNLVPDIL
jgi:uncharacterized protein (DUF488 family)